MAAVRVEVGSNTWVADWGIYVFNPFIAQKFRIFCETIYFSIEDDFIYKFSGYLARSSIHFIERICHKLPERCV